MLAVLGAVALNAVQNTAPSKIESVSRVLYHIFLPISSKVFGSRMNASRLPKFEDYMDTEFKGLAISTKRVWHDTIQALNTFKAGSSQQKKLVKDALAKWLRIGMFVGLKEGVNVTTLEGPSIPSEERRYWRIQRRCFREACICAGVVPSSCHHNLRVCKGCWRVLYCNTRCQDLDWKAGHRLVCKTLYLDE